ncbi:YegS/Rv2252/BmrU family lipid kinase [Microbacterium sp. BE35]|uniref:Diacylglycerol kinase n=2 Tax=Microbacterium trichothecenolyticum TaxID=69370 RepID=A0A0M2HBP9_MICTR|nr:MULTISPECIES: diacylglycerol kinase family protein [Microbacterium]KJL41622.1 Diacylglycerol kinase [Microbacterium trichothecenolyticum]MDR7190697.1 YegS/Rv2252/BmrU family lipid kinase [Microbacterium sp. BE35]
MRAAIVWNPSKIERDTLEAELAQARGEAPIEDVRWWETTEEDPGQGAAEAALAAGAEVLIVAGGDGTVRAVAEHLASTSADAEMAIIPLGTGNLFARNLDIPINDLAAALELALAGEARPIDVGWVEIEREGGPERHAFVVMVGFGLDAHMLAETDDDLKDKAGWLAYVESLGRAWSASDVIPFTITTDDGAAQDREGHTVLVANCGTLQGGMRLVPDADPSDGELDYLVLSAEGLAQWLGTLKTMVWDNGLKRLIHTSDEPTSTDSTEHGRARKVAIALPDAHAFEIDGEEAGDARAFTVTIQPSALRVRSLITDTR